MTESFLTICTLVVIVLASGKWVSGQNHVPISSIVTDEFFNGIINQAPQGNCPARGFYARSAFLQAISSFPRFGTDGSADDAKREIAAFFAHVTFESGHLCYKEEINVAQQFCDGNIREWPCVPGRRYYGRGPLMLSWNFNYGPAGREIGFNGLSNPEIVATDPVISFKTALWLWMRNGHNAIVSGQGFGATIYAFSGALACNGSNPAVVTIRVNYYTTYCSQLRVDPGNNLRC